MEIGGISGLYTDYMTSTATSKADTLTSKGQADYSDSSDEELMEVCKEFEAYFLEQIFDAMIDSAKVFSEDEESSYATKMVDYFKDSAVQEISEQAAGQNGLGIAQTLFDQMKRQYSAVTPEQVAAAKQTEEA